MYYIYFGIMFIVILGLLLFFVYEKRYFQKKQYSNSIVSVNYKLPEQEQKNYIEAANRCKKDNSPVSGCPFHELLKEGSELITNESFQINDEILEGSGYHVV